VNAKPYLKGLYAAVVAFAGGVSAAQPAVSGTEWIFIAAGTVAAGVGVYVIPYQTTKAPPPQG
jgi:hypothetical protein